MTPHSRLLALCGLLLPCIAHAASMPPPTIAMPLSGLRVPADAVPATLPTPTEGSALREQVTQKLKRMFEAADASGTGRVTRVTAKARGLGFVDRNFDAIDQSRAGSVSFADVESFLQRHATAARDRR